MSIIGGFCMKSIENPCGFTLIELLVVVLIIGILAAIALPQYQKAVDKSRVAEAVSLLDSLGKAEEIFYMGNGSYTQNMDDLDISLPKATGDTETMRNTKNFRFSTADTAAVSPTTFIGKATPQWKYPGASLTLTLTATEGPQRTCEDPGATGFCKLMNTMGYTAASTGGNGGGNPFGPVHGGGSGR